MKIYSFKATGNGARITGRIKASDMQDATNQVVLAIQGRPMDISKWRQEELKKFENTNDL